MQAELIYPESCHFTRQKVAQAVEACAIALVYLFSSVSSAADQQHEEFSRIPSITAERITRSSSDLSILSRDRVQMSPEGLRVIQLGARAHSEILQNFVTEQVWLIDRQRSIVHEIEFLTQTETPFENGPTIMTANSARRGLMTIDPCTDLSPRNDGVATWRGMEVSVWNCIDFSGVHAATQFFSAHWKLIIREQRIDGTVDELIRIETVNYTKDHFTPDANYRKVGLRELIVGVPEIDKYSGELENEPL